MKLLFTAQDFPPVTGGIQEYSHQLARAFSSRAQVTVIAPSHPGAREFDRDQPFAVIRYPVGHTSLFGATTPLSIPALCAATDTRVVFHAQWTTAIGSLAAERLGLVDHYFVAAHGRELRTDRLPPLERNLRRAAIAGASGIFPVSGYTADLAIGCGASPSRIHPVSNGVDSRFFAPRDPSAARQRLGIDGRPVVLTASRLVPRKGVDTVIEALHRLADRYPEMLYLVVGDGPDRERLESLAGPLLRTGRVRFRGRVPKDDLPDYYSAADLFVMPAREERDGCVEGFGLVFLEAGGCGTAVIGARSGGIPDAVEDGDNGLLVPPGDPGRLARAIGRLIDDEGLRERLGRNGRARAERMSWARCAQRIFERMAHPARPLPRTASNLRRTA